jgi:hypothetical protein
MGQKNKNKIELKNYCTFLKNVQSFKDTVCNVEKEVRV